MDNTFTKWKRLSKPEIPKRHHLFPGHHNKEEEFCFELKFISSRVLARVRDGNSITKDFATPFTLVHFLVMLLDGTMKEMYYHDINETLTKWIILSYHLKCTYLLLAK